MSTRCTSDAAFRSPGCVARLSRLPGRLAQLGERRLDKAEVTGSSPVSPTWNGPMPSGLSSRAEHATNGAGLLPQLHAGQPGWAEWIAWQGEAARFTMVMQAWDLRSGRDAPT